MIIIKHSDESSYSPSNENPDATSYSYVLWVGEHQKHPMQREDLLDLQRCLKETIHQGEEATPSTNYRVLNAAQFCHVNGKAEWYTEGRATLWSGRKKWHIHHLEVDLLVKNLDELIG